MRGTPSTIAGFEEGGRKGTNLNIGSFSRGCEWPPTDSLKKMGKMGILVLQLQGDEFCQQPK